MPPPAVPNATFGTGTETIEGKVYCNPQGKGVFVVPKNAQRGPVWPRKLWPEGVDEPESGAVVRAEVQRNEKGGMITRIISYSGSIPDRAGARPPQQQQQQPQQQLQRPPAAFAAPPQHPAKMFPRTTPAAPPAAAGGGEGLPKPASWANLVRTNAGSPSDDAAPPEGTRTATPSPPSPRREPSSVEPARIIADRARGALKHPVFADRYQPRPDTAAERQAYEQQTRGTNVDNYGFAALDLMIQQIPQPFSLERITAGYKRKAIRDFAFPSTPPTRYQIGADPNVDVKTGKRMPMFPLCDKHTQYSADLGEGCDAGLETVCLRFSTDSAVFPKLTNDHFGPVGGAANGSSTGGAAADRPLFTKYMLDGYREASHHRKIGWIAALDTPRVIEWLAEHIPAVVDLLVGGMAELCGISADADLPDDVRFAVLVHLGDERVDVYAWSPSERRQLGVCFERWFGGADGYGLNPRSLQ